jgi:hypothetical protein
MVQEYIREQKRGSRARLGKFLLADQS